MPFLSIHTLNISQSFSVYKVRDDGSGGVGAVSAAN